MSFINNLMRDVYGAFRQAAGSSSTAGDIPNQAKVAKDDIAPGDVQILAIKAFKGEVEHDMMSQVTEFHIYESIVSPVVFAHVQIADAINLQEDFIFDEINTYVYVEFQTPGATTPPISYLFKVNHVGTKVDIPSNGMKTYPLQLVSPEAIAAMDGDMEGFKLDKTPKVLVEKIVKERIEENPKILALRNSTRTNGKRHDFHDTKGIIGKNKLQTMILPRNRKPFQALHQISLLSNMTAEGYALHTFFENRHGYNFNTVEKMISDGKKKLKMDQSDAIFVYDNLRNENFDGVKIRNILAYNQINAGNAGESGALGIDSEMRIYNPQTSSFEIVRDNAQADASTAELTSRQAERTFNKTRSDLVITSEMDHLHEVIDRRRRLLLRMTQFEAQILIYGDTNLAVGDVIECIFPRSISTETPTGGDNVSKDSGYYLITHLRHMVLNSDRPQHVISCNLMKAEPARS